MSGHWTWETLKSKLLKGFPEEQQDAAMASWVMGYALALRDIAKDLNLIEERAKGDRDPGEYFEALEAVRQAIKDTTEEVRRTAEALRLQMDPDFRESVEQMRRGEGVGLSPSLDITDRWYPR